MTGREYELLEYLLRNKNEAVTRDMIAREVWKETTGAMTRIIDVYISALRKKIEHPGCRQLIHTLRGIGYALKDGSMKRLSIRWSLTLWYGVVLSAILVGFSGAVYLLMQTSPAGLDGRRDWPRSWRNFRAMSSAARARRSIPESSARVMPATTATSSR